MRTIVEFKLEARSDIKEACVWYESQQAGTGIRFEAALGKVIDRIKRLPELGEEVMPRVRKRLVPSFPYFILYRIEPDRLVVLGVFHYKRDAKSWKDRLDMNGNGV